MKTTNRRPITKQQMNIKKRIYKRILKWMIRERISGSGELIEDEDHLFVLEKPFTADKLILENRLDSLNIRYKPEQIVAVSDPSTESFRLRIEALVAAQRENPDKPFKLQPVMVLAGHLPHAQQPLLKSALMESWSNNSHLTRVIKLLINGRSTLLRIDEPLILKDLMQSSLSDAEIARRAVWVLRTHFQRCRQAILGPDLSHRRTLMNEVLASPNVKKAITETALRQGLTTQQAEKKAEEAIDAIVADFNPSTAKILNHLIHFLLYRLFSRINLHGLDKIQQTALTHSLVYLPCHRSHLDYILLSWLLYRHGLMVPHVAAGDNLNIPVVGGILRRGGAIFMRRSFKDDPLYATIFRAYLTLMLHRGHSIEYFIEGGRSRSGRLLSAKAGLLKMTLEAWQQSPEKPLALIPVSISYDRLVESQSYQRELSGGQKSKENLLDTLKSLRILFQRYGEVSISFGEILKLNKAQLDSDGPPVAPIIGREIIERINQAFSASQMSLIASLMLSAPHQKMRETDLITQLDTLMALLTDLGVELPKGNTQDWINEAENRQQISRGKNALALSADQAAELTFYRNMLMHKLILPGLILLFNRRLASSGVSTQTRLIRALYPYIRAELNLPNPLSNQDLELIHEVREQLQKHHLLSLNDRKLNPLAEHLIRLAEPVLLRQYLLILVMTRLQQASEVELLETTRELALHLHLYYGYAAPEYADRRVFEGITDQLIEQDILTGDSEKLSLSRPLDNVLRLGDKLFPSILIQSANDWLIAKGLGINP